MFKKMLLAVVATLAASAAYATPAGTFVTSEQTTLNFDTTNARIGVNTATPRAVLEVSGTTAGSTLLIVPSVITPTGTVTGTIGMNSNGRLATLTNTTTGTWTSISTPTTVNFVPAN